MARAVADDDDRAEAEAAAALDDLRDAVDLDDALLELATVVRTCSALCHQMILLSLRT
jgi:hypothetical protein